MEPVLGTSSLAWLIGQEAITARPSVRDPANSGSTTDCSPLLACRTETWKRGRGKPRVLPACCSGRVYEQLVVVIATCQQPMSRRGTDGLPLSASIGRVPPIAAPRCLEGRPGSLFAGPGLLGCQDFGRGPRAGHRPSMQKRAGWFRCTRTNRLRRVARCQLESGGEGRQRQRGTREEACLNSERGKWRGAVSAAEELLWGRGGSGGDGGPQAHVRGFGQANSINLCR